MPKTLLLFFLFSGFAGNLYSQNLLANGGFEEENTCTEYQKLCAPEAWISTANGFSNYFKDEAKAHSGTHCFALEAGHTRKPFQRTYVRTQLLCLLRKGNHYKLEFFIRSPHNILDSIGIYFTPYDFLFEKGSPVKITPSIYLVNTKHSFIKGDSSWQKVELDYIANGEERFLTIGNFSKRDITGETGIYMENQFFVFIDDFSLLPLNNQEQICDDWQAVRQEIYDQDARHEFLQRMITTYRRMNKYPEAGTVSRTSVVVVDTLVLPDILFETGKSTLLPGSLSELDNIAVRNSTKRVDSLVVKGHSDNTGTLAFNERLSLDRAKTVASYLSKGLNIEPAHVFTYGYAASTPVADNATPEGRQKNRRVEILIYIRE